MSHTLQNSENSLTPAPGELVYHLNPLEAVLIKFVRERTVDLLAEEFDDVYQTASFSPGDDITDESKESLWDFYMLCEILKGRHKKIEEKFIVPVKKSKPNE